MHDKEKRKFSKVTKKSGKFYCYCQSQWKVGEFVSEVKCLEHKIQPKAESGWKWGEKYQWLAKKAKENVNMGGFSLIKGQWKLLNFSEKLGKFLLSDEWQPWV